MEKRPASVRGNRELIAARMGAILSGNENHDDADGLPALVRLAHIGQLPAILSSDLLPDRIAIRRRGRPDAKQPGRKQAERGKAGKGTKRLHATLSSALPLNGK